VSRVMVLIYGGASYGIALAVFVYSMGFIGGFLTPTMLDGAPDRPLGQALLINLALLAAFALQHSVMARPAFKKRWTRIVPPAAERSTYVLASSIAFGALCLWWAPIGGVIWEAPAGVLREGIIALYIFGWALLLSTTFLIDHFDLFGLKQVWRYFTGETHQAPQFHTPGLYKLVRHPLYIGWLTIFWAAPTMTSAHLLFALITTAYILIAIRFEERDLVGQFGERYVAYRAVTPMLAPRLARADRPRVLAETQARE
jgi:methanethiol S-methyltransferase